MCEDYCSPEDLKIEIDFLEGIVERDPENVDAWEALAHDYTDAKLYDKGLHADSMVVKLAPDKPLSHYNYACSLSLTHHEEQAADELLLSIKLGYKEYRFIEQDPDLDNLREHPAWQAVAEIIKSKGRK